MSISSTASTMICGVISSSALRSCAFAGSLLRSICCPFWRSAATCRCSRSVLVKISPFTFTRICSMISARDADGASDDERAASDDERANVDVS